MRTLSTLLLSLVLAVSLTARPSASHSSIHVSHSYGSSKSYSSHSSGWGSSKPASPSSKSWGSSTPIVKSGSNSSSTPSSQGDTQAPKASTYGGSGTTVIHNHYYNTQPSSWPSDIPMYLLYGGMRRQLMWNSGYHTYGWYNQNNSWTSYDNTMTQQPGTYAGSQSSGGYHHHGYGGSFFLSMLLVVIVLLILIWIIWTIYNRSARGINSPRDGNSIQPSTVAPRTVSRTHVPPVVPVPAVTPIDLASLRAGDIIILSDPLSMEDARSLSSSADGLQVTVNEALDVKGKSRAGSWTLIRGTSQYQNQEVLVKIRDLDGKKAISCLTKDLSGTRKELVDQDNLFLFCQPADENNFDPNQLSFAKSFRRNLNGETEESFSTTLGGETDCLAAARPTITDTKAVVAEWSNVDRDGNEYMALDIDGNVETWWGDAVAEDQIRFFRKTV